MEALPSLYRPSFYRYVQALSIDVCIGALAGASLAARILGAKLPVSFWFVLPAAVFCIYTLDHLLDAHRLGKDCSTFRHQFHYRHFGILLALALLIGGISFILSTVYLARTVLWAGSAVSLGVFLHLVSVQRKSYVPWLKEISIAFYYTLGIWIAPWMHSESVRISEIWMYLLLFFLAAFSNVLLFAYMEKQIDSKDQSVSIGRHFSDSGQKWIVYSVACISLLFWAAKVALDARPGNWELWCFLPPILLPAVMVYFSRWFSMRERYRTWGDGVFVVYAVPWFMSFFF